MQNRRRNLAQVCTQLHHSPQICTKSVVFHHSIRRRTTMNQNDVLRTICAELNLDENDVVNAYQFGSYVYGTNDDSSDRDYLLVVRQSRPALQFTDGIHYFHGFDLKRLFDQYDVCVHSCENFEALLEHHYLLAVECVFYPEEFILKNSVDYRSIFLTRYYNPLRLRQVSLHEREFSLQQCNYEQNYGRHPSSLAKKEDSARVMLKVLFHGVRYLDIAEQLILSLIHISEPTRRS